MRRKNDFYTFVPIDLDLRPLDLSRACERSVSGAENGAERAENGMSGTGAVSGS